MSYEQALLIAIGSLTGAVVFMYAWWLKAYESLRADNKACHEEHKGCIERERAMLERVIRLEERTGVERRTGPTPIAQIPEKTT